MTGSIFVLGAGGFIGRALSEQMAWKGWIVFAATLRPAFFENENIHNVVEQFSEVDSFLPWIEKCDCIVHAASTTTPSSSAAQPQLDGNLRSLLALVEALRLRPGKCLVYLSSGGAIYEERIRLVEESASLRPRSYHGAGKLAAEGFIQAWAAQCGGQAVIFRPSNVYGPGQVGRNGFGIIPTAFECIRSGAVLPIWGDGRSIRDYMYIDDFIGLLSIIVSRPWRQGGGIFNASAGKGVELLELLAGVERVSGGVLNKVHLPSRAGDMYSVIPDNARAVWPLSWRPETFLSDGLFRTWCWFSDANE